MYDVSKSDFQLKTNGELLVEHNPFYDITKADTLSPTAVATLFVEDANPIFEDLKSPIHHFVVGTRGSGKTMALRQLDYRTLANDEENTHFVGAYIHVSRISTIFHTLFAEIDENDDKHLVAQFQQVFGDYLALEIVRVLCELSKPNERLKRPDFGGILQLPSGFDIHNVADACTRLQMLVESSIQSWQISRRCAWHPIGDLPAIMVRLAESLRRSNPWLAKDTPCLYILLDESSPIPHACQRVLNKLLLRGEPYCVKLAIRPYEWHTLSIPSGPAKEPNNDFLALHLEHSDELSAEHVSSMERIVNKVLSSGDENGTLIRDLLPDSPDYAYSGFKSICAASSGNPQDLLMICSAILSAWRNENAIDGACSKPIPPEFQHSVVKRWSSDFVHLNPYEESRKLCLALSKKVKDLPENARSIAFEYQPDEPDLFADDRLPDDLAEPLRPAFSGGFIRAMQIESKSLWNLPRRFRLSRGALPELDLALHTPIDHPVHLDRAFIKTKSKTIHGFGNRQAGQDLVLYFSDSFIEKIDARIEPLRRALNSAQFSFPKVQISSTHLPWHKDTRRQIAKSDIALVGVYGSPVRTMFEIGQCASANRRVDVIVGLTDDNMKALETWTEPLPTVALRTDDDDYKQFATEVRAVAEHIRARHSDFARVALTDVSLRPKRKRTNTVYLSLPAKVSPERIREGLVKHGWSAITEDDMSTYAANALQVPILCAFTARVGVIDTSDEEQSGPIQSYKLGLFAGKRGWRVLHTTNTKSDTFSLLEDIDGVNTFHWQQEDDLVERILNFVQTPEKLHNGIT